MSTSSSAGWRSTAALAGLFVPALLAAETALPARVPLYWLHNVVETDSAHTVREERRNPLVRESGY